MTDFQEIEPGLWAWGEYEIEDDEYAYVLYRAGAYLVECETFNDAVIAAQADADGVALW